MKPPQNPTTAKARTASADDPPCRASSPERSPISSEPTTLTVALTADAHDAFAQAQLQLWVLEDGITSYQVIEDGSRDRSYVHNHVFRASITANPDGEPVKLDGSEVSYSLPIDEKWNAENLSVVIIVSDPATGTVLQAHKVAINN